jgi:hypothetical protein
MDSTNNSKNLINSDNHVNRGCARSQGQGQGAPQLPSPNEVAQTTPNSVPQTMSNSVPQTMQTAQQTLGDEANTLAPEPNTLAQEPNTLTSGLPPAAQNDSDSDSNVVFVMATNTSTGSATVDNLEVRLGEEDMDDNEAPDGSLIRSARMEDS